MARWDGGGRELRDKQPSRDLLLGSYSSRLESSNSQYYESDSNIYIGGNIQDRDEQYGSLENIEE
jgi:hypothetical protein